MPANAGAAKINRRAVATLIGDSQTYCIGDYVFYRGVPEIVTAGSVIDALKANGHFSVEERGLPVQPAQPIQQASPELAPEPISDDSETMI